MFVRTWKQLMIADKLVSQRLISKAGVANQSSQLHHCKEPHNTFMPTLQQQQWFIGLINNYT